jgi:hypothetical protein
MNCHADESGALRVFTSLKDYVIGGDLLKASAARL